MKFTGTTMMPPHSSLPDHKSAPFLKLHFIIFFSGKKNKISTPAFYTRVTPTTLMRGFHVISRHIIQLFTHLPTRSLPPNLPKHPWLQFPALHLHACHHNFTAHAHCIPLLIHNHNPKTHNTHKKKKKKKSPLEKKSHRKKRFITAGVENQN